MVAVLVPLISSDVRIIDESEVFMDDPSPPPPPPIIIGGGGTNGDILLLYYVQNSLHISSEIKKIQKLKQSLTNITTDRSNNDLY